MPDDTPAPVRWTGSAPEGTHALDDAYAQSIAAQAVTPAPVAQPLSPTTEAGRALLEREAYNSRSFPLITAEAIVDIEWQARQQGLDAARSVPDNAAPDYLTSREQGRLVCGSCGCPFTDHNERGCKPHGMHEFRRAYAAVPDNAALREAAQDIVTSLARRPGWVLEHDSEEAEALSAALAAAPASPSGSSPVAAGLDVERLAQAIRTAETRSQMEAERLGAVPAEPGPLPDWYRAYAADVAREYAALGNARGGG